ncbi:MAG: ABC transporter permease [Ignavibacteria bacterium]|nr:ABC transporter permease [Ignavibacteria bacterium]
MEFILFIVRRFNSARKAMAGFSFFSFIVIIGIAIGAAALIISLTVLNGFEHVLRDRLINLDSHILVYAYRGSNLPAVDLVIPQIKKHLGNNLVKASPIIEKTILIGKGKKRDGVQLRGIRPDYFQGRPSIKLCEGSLTPNGHGIVIGKHLAERLFIKLGDRVSVFSLKYNALPDAKNPPVFEQFTVTGLFESGIARFDDEVVYTDLAVVSDLFGYTKAEATGIELRLQSTDNLNAITSSLADVLPSPYRAVSIYRLYSNIFAWIELQKKPIPIILGLIILVAVFNVISVTLMLVLEKSGAIGILRTMGTKRRVIGSIFLFQGVYLSIIGILVGNLLAFFACWLQMKYNIITLPANVYFTSRVPMLPSAQIYLEVSLAAFFMSIFVSVVPAYIASKFSPVTTLRFQ